MYEKIESVGTRISEEVPRPDRIIVENDSESPMRGSPRKRTTVLNTPADYDMQVLAKKASVSDM